LGMGVMRGGTGVLDWLLIFQFCAVASGVLAVLENQGLSWGRLG